MFTRRNILAEISDAIETSPVVLLNGARQTGKSTLAQWIAKQYDFDYVTLDDFTVLDSVSRDPVGYCFHGRLLTFCRNNSVYHDAGGYGILASWKTEFRQLTRENNSVLYPRNLSPCRYLPKQELWKEERKRELWNERESGSLGTRRPSRKINSSSPLVKEKENTIILFLSIIYKFFSHASRKASCSEFASGSISKTCLFVLNRMTFSQVKVNSSPSRTTDN